MRAIQIRVSTLLNAGTSALIGLLGFSAASCEEQADMYGTPYAKFEATGTVTDESGAPVENATVQAEQVLPEDVEISDDYTPYVYATTTTDAQGSYKLATTLVISEEKLKIVCMAPPESDLENAEKTLDIADLELITSKKDDTWQTGIYKPTVDFTLKKK